MENLTVLLEKLAEKLGTTTEYLWGVLIKQAPISAITDLLYFILVIIGGVVLFKIHKRFMNEDEKGDNVYYKLEEGAIIPMIIFAIMWGIVFIICFFSIGNMINGFFNPEYWALNRVLGLCN